MQCLQRLWFEVDAHPVRILSNVHADVFRRGFAYLFLCANESQLGDVVSSKDVVGETVLSKAVESGDVKLFEVVRECAWACLSLDQVN